MAYSYARPDRLLRFLRDMALGRGWALERALPLVTRNPARRAGLAGKGVLLEGGDADVLVRPSARARTHTSRSCRVAASCRCRGPPRSRPDTAAAGAWRRPPLRACGAHRVSGARSSRPSARRRTRRRVSSIGAGCPGPRRLAAARWPAEARLARRDESGGPWRAAGTPTPSNRPRTGSAPPAPPA